MVASMRSGSIVAMCSFALALSTFSATASAATASGESEIPNSTTSTSAQIETTKLSEQDRQAINKTFGHPVLPPEASALQKDSDKVHVLDANGRKLPVDVATLSEDSSNVQLYSASAGDEIKRAVGACIGVDLVGSVTAWEAIESQVTDWNKAAKFVLRRVGLVAALSCGGGIFAEYLL